MKSIFFGLRRKGFFSHLLERAGWFDSELVDVETAELEPLGPIRRRKYKPKRKPAPVVILGYGRAEFAAAAAGCGSVLAPIEIALHEEEVLLLIGE